MKKCYYDCSQDKCGVNVEKELPCGHKFELKCSLSPEDFVKYDKHGCPN